MFQKETHAIYNSPFQVQPVISQTKQVALTTIFSLETGRQSVLVGVG